MGRPLQPTLEGQRGRSAPFLCRAVMAKGPPVSLGAALVQLAPPSPSPSPVLSLQNPEGLAPSTTVVLRLKNKPIDIDSGGEQTIVELVDGNKNTDVRGAPNLETHLVQNDLFNYFITAELNFSGARVAREGLLVLKSFQVDCVVG